LRVSRADAEHEPAGVAVLHPREGAGHLVRAVLPYVHDAGAHGEGARRVEQLIYLGQVAAGRAAEPERAVTGLLDLGGHLGRHLISASPDPEPSQLVPQLLRHVCSLQCESRLTSAPLDPTRKSRSAPVSACCTWSTYSRSHPRRGRANPAVMARLGVRRSSSGPGTSRSSRRAGTSSTRTSPVFTRASG